MRITDDDQCLKSGKRSEIYVQTWLRERKRTFIGLITKKYSTKTILNLYKGKYALTENKNLCYFITTDENLA